MSNNSEIQEFDWAKEFPQVCDENGNFEDFYVEEGVYSKNIVKMHSESNLISDKVMTCLLNY
jgi:hypothetical protein